MDDAFSDIFRSQDFFSFWIELIMMRIKETGGYRTRAYGQNAYAILALAEAIQDIGGITELKAQNELLKQTSERLRKKISDDSDTWRW